MAEPAAARGAAGAVVQAAARSSARKPGPTASSRRIATSTATVAIYGGTSEIMKTIIAREVTGLRA
ncbi:MAG: hypothetical protein ACRDOH_18200 [Streptosporangiaceae bacterium]